jgi:predicted TIM-barrel fold metal-dependent hydrolase
VILDGHIHIHPTEGARDQAGFAARIEAAGVQGGVLLSIAPPNVTPDAPNLSADARLDDLLAWCEAGPNLYPFYWIDPIEDDAIEQVDAAIARGVAGFKVICDRYPPGDPRAMATYAAIANAGRPILFHSGILWDGKPSSPYNRPAGFEALLEVDGLRFCLAHIGWPWCDELIAVYGKFLNAYTRRPDLSVEMYIDITPGTPPIYRRDALTKLFTVGYDVANNVIFGSDLTAHNYRVQWVREWIDRDGEIYRDLGLGQEVLDGIYGQNLKRFLGLSPARVEKQLPQPGA